MIDWHVAERQELLADILVTSEAGWPVAIVEVKNRPGLGVGIASSIRRNLMTNGSLAGQAPYFLVVSDEVGWIWVRGREHQPQDSPEAEFAMQQVVRHYASWLAPGERLSSGALEFVVANWLSDVAAGTAPILDGVTEPLSRTGFLESLNGKVVRINERG